MPRLVPSLALSGWSTRPRSWGGPAPLALAPPHMPPLSLPDRTDVLYLPPHIAAFLGLRARRWYPAQDLECMLETALTAHVFAHHLGCGQHLVMLDAPLRSLCGLAPDDGAAPCAATWRHLMQLPWLPADDPRRADWLVPIEPYVFVND